MMRTRYRLYTVPVLTLIAGLCGVAAQVRIHGKVTHGDEGEPLEFATVRIAGTAIGVTTDLQGGYSLTAPESDTIKVVFSCMAIMNRHAG